jgi:CDP-diacylglycerol--glycerol-3-phosphate 3-phosphatidyltransferase
VLSREEYLAAWSRWHGGTGTESGLVRGWLSLAYGLARPLAGLPPVVATALGLLVAGAAVWPAAAAGGWLVVAGVLVGLSALLDSLDGALALAGGRGSRRGFVLDSAVDRLTEAAYAAALWAAGAPGWLAAAFGALCWLPDYLRARAGQAGVAETGTLSVWERPARIAMTGMTLAGAGAVLLVYPLVQGREQGWPLWIVAMLVAAVPVIAAFGRHQVRRKRSGATTLVEPSVFRNRSYVSGASFAMVFLGAMGGLMLALTAVMQIGLGYSPIEAS